MSTSHSRHAPTATLAGTVNLGVADPMFGDNTGTWTICADGARRTDAAADVEVDIATLSAAYLGAVSWHDLAASGAVSASPGELEPPRRPVRRPPDPVLRHRVLSPERGMGPPDRRDPFRSFGSLVRRSVFEPPVHIDNEVDGNVGGETPHPTARPVSTRVGGIGVGREVDARCLTDGATRRHGDEAVLRPRGLRSRSTILRRPRTPERAPGKSVSFTLSGVVGPTFCLTTVRSAAGVPARVSNTRLGVTDVRSEVSLNQPFTSTTRCTSTSEVKHTSPAADTGVSTALGDVGVGLEVEARRLTDRATRGDREVAVLRRARRRDVEQHGFDARGRNQTTRQIGQLHLEWRRRTDRDLGDRPQCGRGSWAGVEHACRGDGREPGVLGGPTVHVDDEVDRNVRREADLPRRRDRHDHEVGGSLPAWKLRLDASPTGPHGVTVTKPNCVALVAVTFNETAPTPVAGTSRQADR